MSAPQIRAKPLAWSNGPDASEWISEHGFHIEAQDGEFIVTWGEGPQDVFPTLEEAKQWAQDQIDGWVRDVAELVDDPGVFNATVRIRGSNPSAPDSQKPLPPQNPPSAHCAVTDPLNLVGEDGLTLPTLDGFRGLHPDTLALVRRFAYALACKLSAAERKYGYTDGWLRNDWMDECRYKLVDHVAKGDPRDVAAYCAFLWHHGERTGIAATWRPMDTAPRDGTMIRLLVNFTEHATEDSPDPSPTIGANNVDNDGEDEWLFAGWCWTHDHFTEGKGTPIGWLPMLDTLAQADDALDQGEVAKDAERWRFLIQMPWDEAKSVVEDPLCGLTHPNLQQYIDSKLAAAPSREAQP